MSSAPDFSDAELYQIREMLTQHYHKDVEIHLADNELISNNAENEPRTYPTVLWQEQGANFVILKMGTGEYRARFFYTPHDQFGIDSYNNLDECVTAVLQTQLARE